MNLRPSWAAQLLLTAWIACWASTAVFAAGGGESGPKNKKSGAQVEISDSGFRVQNASGDFSLRIGGRIQIDAAVFDEDASTMDNGAAVRRARIYLKGTLDRNWGYKAQFELSDGDVDIKDLYLRYTTEPGTTITLGQFKEPFSLEEQISSKNTTFLERALPVAAFAPSRAMGIGAHHSFERSSIAAGLFGEPVTNSNNGADQGFGVATRVTWAPVLRTVDGEQRVLHLGVASEYRQPRVNEQIRFRARPEASVTDARLVRTRNLADVDSTDRYGAEWAFTDGSLSAQGEYILTRVQRPGRPTGELAGWYLYVSWFPTGEHRPYSVDEGTFGRVKPRSPRGAWEVAVRFSRLDLNNLDIAGGQEENSTVALNWYPNNNLRFMANYILVDSERRGQRDDPGIFLLRAQVAF